VTNFNTIIQAEPWQDSYPARLKAGGYYMGYVGKHHLGGGGSNFIGLYGTYDYNKSYDGGGSYFDMTIQGEPANGRHLTKFLGDLSLGFIDQVVDPAKNPQGKPFCLHIGFKAPHVDNTGDAFRPDPAYDSLYVDDTMVHAKTDTPAQFQALPSFFKSGTAAGTVRWKNRFSTEEKFQENIKKHHRLIHGVDVQIGRILAKLDDPNGDGNTSDSLRDNTLIILSSDNGFFLGERQQAGKWYIQEESIRVPMVIYDPALPPSLRGKRVRQMALNIDLPVTMLDYAGVPIPGVMQGRSLKPIVEGDPPADWRTVFLHDHPSVGSPVFRNEGVRTENFSFTRYPGNGNVMQLYDVTVDPYQRTNLAGDPRYATKLAELDALTTQLKAAAAQ
jgi:arylsulfatase A-like enzyme